MELYNLNLISFISLPLIAYLIITQYQKCENYNVNHAKVHQKIVRIYQQKNQRPPILKNQTTTWILLLIDMVMTIFYLSLILAMVIPLLKHQLTIEVWWLVGLDGLIYTSYLYLRIHAMLKLRYARYSN